MIDPGLIADLYVFVLAGFLVYQVISRVSPLLHTPLMSATNAISGISLIGSLVVAGADYSPLSTALGFIAVTCSATNVVGGFLITDRMLKMFKRRQDSPAQPGGRQFTWKLPAAVLVLGAGCLAILQWRDRLPSVPATEVLRYLYIVSGVLFILGLKGLSSPKYARRGMFLAEFGMLVAIVGTLFHEDIKSYVWIVIGLFLGSVIGG